MTTTADKPRSNFIPAPARLIAACHRTARVVGYRVPCPTRVPPGLIPFGGTPKCPLQIISPGRKCPNTYVSWRGWVVGSSTTPPATNDGSAFMYHVVLIWTVGQHTYGVGFHNMTGIHQTLTLDKELAKGIKLIGP